MSSISAYKQKVRKSFNQAAEHYNSAARLQQHAAKKLMEFSDAHLSDQAIIIDLGGGTGFISDILIKKKISANNIISIDIAEKMLLTNVKILKKSICADADFIPLKNNSVDVVFSNLTLQWMPNLKNTFKEIFRILKHNGAFIFSSLGENTLSELRRCWNQIDTYTHVNSFLTDEKIAECLNYSGFSIEKKQLENIIQNYESIFSLMTNLKKTGAHNVNFNAPKGLSGRNKFQQLKVCYEQYRNPKKLLSATYELIYFQGRKSNG